MNSIKVTGFTMIEMLVVILVISVTMAIALPSFNAMLNNNRITTDTNRLVNDIQLARSESMKRGVRVILCRSGDTTVANPVCGGTAKVWSTGWLVFASGDTNNTYEPANDTLIKVAHAVAKSVSLKSNSTSNANLQFNPDASTNEGGSTAVFAICDDRGESFGNEIQVPPVGRPRLADTVSNCSPTT